MESQSHAWASGWSTAVCKKQVGRAVWQELHRINIEHQGELQRVGGFGSGFQCLQVSSRDCGNPSSANSQQAQKAADKPRVEKYEVISLENRTRPKIKNKSNELQTTTKYRSFIRQMS